MTSPNMTSSILKLICLYPQLKINYGSKFDSSITFGLAVGQCRFVDTRWQTLKAKKGGSPMSKTWGFFLVAQGMILSHRAKFQLIINYKRFQCILSYFYRTIELPTVPECPGQSRNRRLASRVPDQATSVPEFTDNQGVLTYKAM